MKQLVRLLGMVRDVAGILWDRELVLYADRRLRNEDGTYKRYYWSELPLGLRKTRKFLFTACPEIARQILHQNASLNSPSSSFDLGWVGEMFRDEFGEILFVLPHETHLQLRQSMSQYFRQNLDKRFGPSLFIRANELVDRWIKASGNPINATLDLNYFSSQAIIDNFIGYVEDPLRLHEAMKVILQSLERTGKMKRPLPKTKIAKARRAIEEISAEACKKSAEGTSLLKVLSEAKDADQSPLFTKNQVEAMGRFLFLAGQVTIGSVLPALLHHCGEKYQLEVRKEWEETARDRTSIDDVVEFAKKSKWIQALVNEALRLFPPAYDLARVASEDTQIGELSIPKGTTVLLYIILFQKDKRYWGDDAEKFLPERWFEIYRDGKNPPFMPFGVGPNNCLGQPFARLEIGILLTLFCLRTQWKPLTQFKIWTKVALSSKEDVLLSVSPLPSNDSKEKTKTPSPIFPAKERPVEPAKGRCPFS